MVAPLCSVCQHTVFTWKITQRTSTLQQLHLHYRKFQGAVEPLCRLHFESALAQQLSHSVGAQLLPSQLMLSGQRFIY